LHTLATRFVAGIGKVVNILYKGDNKCNNSNNNSSSNNNDNNNNSNRAMAIL
jgi:hypothetical protein